MKTRALTIVSIVAAVALSAGCTAVYRNSNACEAKMRSAASEEASTETLKIAHTGAGIDGTRVVVEGTFEHVMTAAEAASEAKAAAPAARGVRTPASAPLAAGKPKKVVKAAAVECTFDTTGLTSFHWLAPITLAKPASEAAGESAE